MSDVLPKLPARPDRLDLTLAAEECRDHEKSASINRKMHDFVDTLALAMAYDDFHYQPWTLESGLEWAHGVTPGDFGLLLNAHGIPPGLWLDWFDGRDLFSLKYRTYTFLLYKKEDKDNG